MMRIPNVIMASIGIIIGYIYSRNNFSYQLILLIISGATALGFGNVINDVFDIETDKISHPNRPIPKGLISIKEATYFSILLIIISLTSSLIVSTQHFIATLIPIIILYFYALKFKGTPLIGNIVVAVLVAYTLIFGGLNGKITPLFIPAMLAFISTICREIIKDLADKEGDNRANIRTTAILPKKVINNIIYLLFIIYTLIAPLPYFLNIMGIHYLLIIILFVFPLHILWILFYKKEQFNKSATYLKFQMIFGLVAVIIELF